MLSDRLTARPHYLLQQEQLEEASRLPPPLNLPYPLPRPSPPPPTATPVSAPPSCRHPAGTPSATNLLKHTNRRRMPRSPRAAELHATCDS